MEDCILEVKGEVQQIFKVLSKEQHDKMPFEGIEIAKTLARLPFFRRHFDTNSENFINLCISQDTLQLDEGVDVYEKEKKDGRERYLYVILEGTVLVSSKECGRKRLGMLRVFGQTEVLFGLDDRRESVVTQAECKLMRIRESAIMRIFTGRDYLKKNLHFLKVNSYFQDLEELQKMQLTLAMTRKAFQRGQILKPQNEGTQNVLFFIYGKVEVTVNLSYNSKMKEFIIDSLQEMSSFGQYESSTKMLTPIKLIGFTSGAYYMVNYPEMVKEEHRIISIINTNAIGYPNSEQLLFLQGVKSTLKKEETRVMKNHRSARLK